MLIDKHDKGCTQYIRPASIGSTEGHGVRSLALLLIISTLSKVLAGEAVNRK